MSGALPICPSVSASAKWPVRFLAPRMIRGRFREGRASRAAGSMCATRYAPSLLRGFKIEPLECGLCPIFTST